MVLPPNIDPQDSPSSLLTLLREGDSSSPIMIQVTYLGLLVLNVVALKSSFSSSVTQHHKWRLDRLNFAVSRSHKIRHTHRIRHAQPVGLLWPSGQLSYEPLPTRQSTKNIDEPPCPQRDWNPQSHSSSSCRPTP